MKEALEHDEEFVSIFSEEELLAGLSKLHYEICDTDLEWYTDIVHDAYEYIYNNYHASFDRDVE